MALASTVHQTLSALRRAGSSRLRRAKDPEVAPLIARLLAFARTIAIEERMGGIAFRLQAANGGPEFLLTCVLHHPPPVTLTGAEQAVSGLLCEGRTLAHIAHLRGVSTNTVKSQVRQIFRKFNVETRVALVRRLCP
jgi:DNA-binding NarL/FixJ family response regulator